MRFDGDSNQNRQMSSSFLLAMVAIAEAVVAGKGYLRGESSSKLAELPSRKIVCHELIVTITESVCLSIEPAAVFGKPRAFNEPSLILSRTWLSNPTSRFTSCTPSGLMPHRDREASHPFRFGLRSTTGIDSDSHKNFECKMRLLETQSRDKDTEDLVIDSW